MSLAQPLWLLALLAIPTGWALYRRRHQRARRFAVRFPAAASLRGALPVVAPWRRHLPALLALAALVPLSVALARPRATVSVPREQASIVLVVDHSGSMAAGDVEPTRLAAAQQAANTFIDELPDRVQVGAVTYADGVDAGQQPDADHDLARKVIDAQTPGGATATGNALRTALGLLERRAPHAPAAIVLLSDGKTTTGADPVEAARQSGSRRKVPIYTVSLGEQGTLLQNPNPFAPPLDVSPDPQTLRQVARVSGGRAFTAADSERLQGIYRDLGSRLGSRPLQREVTAAFAAGGLVLLLAAGAAGHRRPVRLV